MAGIAALDGEKLTKSKRGLDREGSPKLDDEQRRGRREASKRTRKDGDDSESVQKDVDILEEVVDAGHHAIADKHKDKDKSDKGMQLPGVMLPTTLARDPKAIPAAVAQIDVYTYAPVTEEPMVVPGGMLAPLVDLPSRGWTEPVKEQKKTHFSAKETEILRGAIIEYCKRIGYKEESISDFLFSKKRDLNTGRDGIWPEIAKCLPHRSVASVYYHAKRKFRQLTRGEWTDADVEELRKLVQQHGTKWEKIGVALNRTSHSCRDKWRDLSVPLMPTAGKWSKEEDKRLREAVMEVHGGTIPESGILWSQVAEKMKETGRARSQCRFRWESLKKGFDGEDVKQFWSQQDCLLLLQRIQESGVEDETEIVWRQIQPQGFANRTAKDLYNKWRYLKSLYCTKNYMNQKEPIDKVLTMIREGITSSKPT